MNIVLDDPSLRATLDEINEPELRELLSRLADRAKAVGLWQVTCIALVEPGDSAEALGDLLGFDPIVGPLGDPDGEFLAWWDRLEYHRTEAVFELLHTIGTEFAYILLVKNSGPDRSGLVALCRKHCAT
ncbi:hypothetical protein GRI40_06050 [Altererythrobacter aerius]|uniref:Uncharacterized protein n=1 Tax=Tsuneonella aeria TaxID=1837929 RepID=A0A6I4TC07_9SPHN|nr:hypothetical protein [Tsuneonella aeria]MXO74782.1 hypothetical protein [Tsuneonella aeria]